LKDNGITWCLKQKHGIRLIDPNQNLTKAKQTRIDTQYYVEKEHDQTEIKNNVEAARKFVLEIEQTIENITPEQINSIRTQLKQATKP
jgi:DNA-binding transcriptional regulator YiaG